jgi:hypothetical protein
LYSVRRLSGQENAQPWWAPLPPGPSGLRDRARLSCWPGNTPQYIQPPQAVLPSSLICW